MNENFPDNPQIQVLKSGKTGLFTNYIYKAIPLAFDESMSYYETLCGLLNYLKNVVIPTVNNNADAVAELQTLYEQLRTYVEDYFTNLDVQEEINNKLDAMVEDGTLDQIIEQYLNSSAIWGFNTVADMKNATNLINGSYARTLGYYSKNDGGNALYKIRNITNEDVVDNMFIIPLNDETLIAELIINDYFIIDCIGAKGDGINDDSNYFQKALTKTKIINGNPLKTYKSDININSNNITLNNINLKGTITLGENLRFINITNCDIDATDKNYGIYANYNVVKLIIENCFIHNANNTGLYLNKAWDYQINKVSISSNTIMGVYLNKFNSSIFNGTCYNNGIGLQINDSYSSNVRATIQENQSTGIDVESVVGSKFHLYLEQNGYNGNDDKTKSQLYIGSSGKTCISNEFTIYANGGSGSEMESDIGIYSLYCENSKINGYLLRHKTTGIHISSHTLNCICDIIDLNHVDYGYDKQLEKHIKKSIIQSNTVFDLKSNEDCIPVINGDTPYLIAFIRRSSTQALIRVKDIDGTNQSVECNCYIISNGIRTTL